MIVNEKIHYFTVLTLYYDKFAGILPKWMQKIKNAEHQPDITATILFIFTIIEVKYACNRMATRPAESVL